MLGNTDFGATHKFFWVDECANTEYVNNEDWHYHSFVGAVCFVSLDVKELNC